jgi:acylphosphatase|nr:acylphosphatase [uncultured Methanoregula sp.]
MERITAVARGKVQGVGYRQYVSECARRMGIHGEVMNIPDGTVRIIVEGSPSILEDFLCLVHAEDDPLIRVEALDVKREPATGGYKGFWVHW